MAVKPGKCAHACSVSQDSNLFFKLEGDCFTVLSLLYNMNWAISIYTYPLPWEPSSHSPQQGNIFEP